MLYIKQNCFNIYGFVSLTLLDFEQSVRTYAWSDSLMLQRTDTQVSIENYHDAI